ncbi:MAG: hypothetical protein ACOCUS_05760, partial [Polyangiales bacterium]
MGDDDPAGAVADALRSLAGIDDEHPEEAAAIAAAAAALVRDRETAAAAASTAEGEPRPRRSWAFAGRLES